MQIHGALWKQMCTMEWYLKSHESLFQGFVFAVVSERKQGSDGVLGGKGLRELRITLHSGRGNLHVYWSIGNNERLKNLKYCHSFRFFQRRGFD